jgi:hypothetical protein
MLTPTRIIEGTLTLLVHKQPRGQCGQGAAIAFEHFAAPSVGAVSDSRVASGRCGIRSNPDPNDRPDPGETQQGSTHTHTQQGSPHTHTYATRSAHGARSAVHQPASAEPAAWWRRRLPAPGARPSPPAAPCCAFAAWRGRELRAAPPPRAPPPPPPPAPEQRDGRVRLRAVRASGKARVLGAVCELGRSSSRGPAPLKDR